MIFQTIFIICLAIVPASVFAVDVAAMETMLEALEKNSTKSVTSTVSCDHTLAAPTGYKLPSDFDFCQPQRQPNLMRNGLYVNSEGEIKPLSVPLVTPVPGENDSVIVPYPDKKDVEPQPHIPFLLDLTLPTQNSRNNTPVIITEPAVIIERSEPVQAPVPGAQLRPTPPRFGCPDLQTFAHRGSPDEAENSIEAIVHALQAGHNGAEIDVQQLKDGNWVVHHDLIPGRVSYGQRGLITSMQSYQWRQIRLKDRKGAETKIQAPFLDDLLIAYSKNAHALQLLNIEIKGGVKSYSCNALAGLNKRVLSHLSQSQFVYSSRYIEHLTCLRTANPSVYLGVIVDPHQDSIDIPSTSNLGRAVSLYDRFKGATASKELYVENNNRSHLTRTSFADVRSLIGPYYGFHIDYRDYSVFAPNYSKSQGRLVLYQLDDDAGQIALLNEIRQQNKKLPDGVLVDTDLESYCGLRNTL